MPSRRSSRRSERSSCFVVVSSRNAANISVEPAMHSLHGRRATRLAVCWTHLRVLPSSLAQRLHFSHQGGFTDIVEREHHLGTVFLPEHHPILIRDRHDVDPLPP